MNFRDRFRAAGMPGIVLALASIAYMLVHYYCFVRTGYATGSTSGKIILNLVDLIKICLCIWLMRFFMDRIFLQTDCSLSDLRKTGSAMAFLSAITYAAASMAFYQWHPDLVRQIMDIFIESADQLDSNSRKVMEILEENFARMMFFSNLIYCYLFGSVLAAILAPRIIARHFSATNKPL